MPSLPQDAVIRRPSPLDLDTESPYENAMRKIRKKKKKGTITANVAGTKFEIVRLVIDEMGFLKTPDEDETSNLLWCDSAVPQEKISELQNYQRINHFPGMGEICRKDFLARNMTKMIKTRPMDYTFVPRTWIFPAEYTQFQNYVKELKKKRKQKTFIVKPANGAMGHGISLIRNGDKLPSQDHLIVQEYIEKPFLMEGYKFDLRIYILVTSSEKYEYVVFKDENSATKALKINEIQIPDGFPTRVDLASDTASREKGPTQLYMHLTNYSVNKHNEHFERDETENKGSKRSIRWFTEFLQANHHDVAKFWSDISDLVVKTLIVAEPHVLHAYRMCRPGQPPGSESVCFEVLGFDILLDRKLKPWLLEINRAPSFGTDQKIDYDVKKGVLLNALKLLNIRTSDKRRNLAKQKAEAQRRLYGQTSLRRLLPGSSDWEQQRHQLVRRKEELKERLAQVRKQISKEEHENRHMGNYRRIYPPEDRALLEKYENLLAVAFQTFLSGRAASLQREMNNPLKRMKEEDILDLLEQCELDDEKLMGKATKLRGPKVQYHYHLVLRNSMRRSVSCPRSISAQSPSTGENRPFSAQQMLSASRPTSGVRSHSLNRASSYMRHLPQSNDSSSTNAQVSESLRQLKTKEQEDDLTSQTLFVLKDMKIRFPGKSEAESELLLEDVLDIVRTSLRTVLPRIWSVPDVDELNLYRIFNRVFNRLLWNHGQGLWNCFCDSGSSWESIFSKSPDVVSPLQLQCCQRLVELCKQCLLVVYKYATETRGSFSGMGPDWGNSRYLLPGSAQFFMRTSTYNWKYSSPGMTRSNVLFTPRYGHF
ncbi:tubulin polyglutamylase TTLL7 [Echinops telfairi]|uniref:Tubulin polyglutamylase TTLL7 n=1 Tax=Echinops telfairi TaxID=9371 RepID=A0AC55D8B8_ECHTE|nr:tubulin polyglutamylase TTLL7 [Echinops telfairi]